MSVTGTDVTSINSSKSFCPSVQQLSSPLQQNQQITYYPHYNSAEQYQQYNSGYYQQEEPQSHSFYQNQEPGWSSNPTSEQETPRTNSNNQPQSQHYYPYSYTQHQYPQQHQAQPPHALVDLSRFVQQSPTSGPIGTSSSSLCPAINKLSASKLFKKESGLVDSGSEVDMSRPASMSDSQMIPVRFQNMKRGARTKAGMRKLKQEQRSAAASAEVTKTSKKKDTTVSRIKRNSYDEAIDAALLYEPPYGEDEVEVPKNTSKGRGKQSSSLSPPNTKEKLTPKADALEKINADSNKNKIGKRKTTAAIIFATKSTMEVAQNTIENKDDYTESDLTKVETGLTKSRLKTPELRTTNSKIRPNSKSNKIKRISLKVVSGAVKIFRGSDEEDPDEPLRKLNICDRVASEFDESIPWECIFCGLGPLDMKLGDLFGPYYVHSTVDGVLCKKEIWLHQDCALWAPGVILVGSTLRGIDEAVYNAERQDCGICQKKGATIGCLTKSCTSSVHFPCGKLNGWSLDYQTFHSYCYEHKGVSSFYSGR